MNKPSRLRSEWHWQYLRQGLGFGPFTQELNIMRKFVTAAATVLTLGTLSLASPAIADQNSPNYGPQGQHQNYGPGHGQPGYGQPGYGQPGHDGRRGDDGYRQGDRNYDWNRQEGNSDRWERGWGRGGWENDRKGRQLSHWQLVRRLEAQGYYGARGFRQSPHGWGLRAFAFNHRGRPVMLRVNPITGRVLDVRRV